MNEVLPSVSEHEVVEIRRRSHDFARRWMNGFEEDIRRTDDNYVRDTDSSHVKGKDSERVLRSLLESLQVPMPFSRKKPGWFGQHLYPYVGELVHYDAVRAKKGVKTPTLEQYFYRGGGGLAHFILRSDPDQERLSLTRNGLSELVADSDGPLGLLAKACSANDHAQPDKIKDEREASNQIEKR